jgi:glycine/D-amino acid oxidase-like deaminating enzyme
VRRYAGEWLPGLVPEPASVTTCLYTTTPTEDFVLDRVGPVVVASPCSGHGFKFTPEIGRLVAGLAMGAPPEVPRFTLPAHAAAARPSGHR